MSPDVRAAMGTAVRQRRTALGWSQERLAQEARVDRTYISGLERGIRNPALTTLERIATALGVGIGDLLLQAGEQT